VTDPANDKAAALGIDVPAGTWMLSAHIPDADFWEKEVKSGNITGFSIEGLNFAGLASLNTLLASSLVISYCAVTPRNRGRVKVCLLAVVREIKVSTSPNTAKSHKQILTVESTSPSSLLWLSRQLLEPSS
jgi:Putative phage serine protease XkdF